MTVLLEERDVATSKRITLLIPHEAYHELMELADVDGLTMSDRLQALVQLWESDPQLRERTTEVARELAAAKRRRRRGQG